VPIQDTTGAVLDGLNSTLVTRDFITGWKHAWSRLW